MKLSIIVPVYNVEAYLCRCIDSILNQTFTDFELILVDDGSPDACGKICDEYALQDKRIKVIHKKNGGLSDARNAGLDIAKGEFIGFVDSDDKIEPTMYERLIDTAEETGADIAAGGLSILNEQNEVIDKCPNPGINRVFTREDFLENFYPEVWLQIWPTVTDKIFRRHVFKEVRFPLGKINEDNYVQLALYAQCQIIVTNLQYAYFYYAGRPESITNTNYSAKNFSYIDWTLHHYYFFATQKNKKQAQYALSEYLVAYLRNFFFVYMKRRDLKSAFAMYEKQFHKLLINILTNEKICKMHKLVVIIMHINKKFACMLCRKYLPTSIPKEMRK